MASKRKIEVVIAGDASSLKRAFGKAEGASKRFGDTFKGVAGGVVAGIAGAFAVDRLLDFGGELLSLGTQITALRI